MEKFENVTYFNHPLIQHKISILRKKETGTNEFRHLVEEIAEKIFISGKLVIGKID